MQNDDKTFNKIVHEIEKENKNLLRQLSMPKQSFEAIDHEIENFNDHI